MLLKTAAAVGAALTIQPTMNKVQAANAAINGDDNRNMQKVIAFRIVHWVAERLHLKCQLGFGVMGMTYNRSQHPDKKACVRLLHEAVERGVTLLTRLSSMVR